MTEPAFLLDSNICIYILRDAGSPPALRIQMQPLGSVVTSAIVAAEVLRGMSDREAGEAVARLFAVVPIVPFDVGTAWRYRDVPFQRGKFDRLIAAHTLALGLTLVTNNEADFADIPDLKVENWALPLA